MSIGRTVLVALLSILWDWVADREVIIKTNHVYFLDHNAFVKKSCAVDFLCSLTVIGDIHLISYIFLVAHSPVTPNCLDFHNSGIFPIVEV